LAGQQASPQSPFLTGNISPNYRNSAQLLTDFLRFRSATVWGDINHTFGYSFVALFTPKAQRTPQKNPATQAPMMTQAGENLDESCKRGFKAEVPFGYETLLTDGQRRRLDECRELGWELQFIRRSLADCPTVIVRDNRGRQSWRICDDGTLESFAENRG
jgi:hypothetical protein